METPVFTLPLRNFVLNTAWIKALVDQVVHVENTSLTHGLFERDASSGGADCAPGKARTLFSLDVIDSSAR